MMTTIPFLEAFISGRDGPSTLMVILMGVGFVIGVIVYVLHMLKRRQRINGRGRRQS